MERKILKVNGVDMVKRKKKVMGIMVCIVVGSTLLAFILNLLFKIHTNGIFMAEWNAGDALNYVASILGAASTFVLGYVAYMQNDKLQKMEYNNYIANYSSMLLIKNIKVANKATIPVNWNIHAEQIIVDVDASDEKEFVGYTFTFKASKLGDALPAMIHIVECNIFCGDKFGKINKSHLFGKNYANIYSRVAMHQDGNIQFGMTYVVDRQKKETFENAIKQISYDVIIEIVFDVITNKNVVTKCKCRSYCHGQNYAGEINWEDKDPMVFFYGHDLLFEEKLKISGEE